MSQEKPKVLSTRTTNSEDRIEELETANTRLQGLVAELLFNNQRLLSARLADRMEGDSSDRFPRNPKHLF